LSAVYGRKSDNASQNLADCTVTQTFFRDRFDVYRSSPMSTTLVSAVVNP
jgi:hypothetical protein